MPTTLGGLVIVLVALLPGLAYFAVRQSQAPQRSLSSTVEVAYLIAVSVAAIGIAIAVFGLLRTALPEHTPDVRRWILEGSGYVAPRVGYTLGWSFFLLILACALAVGMAFAQPHLARRLSNISPTVSHVSAWYYMFESCPDGSYIHVGLDLQDDSYISGRLDWYSTEINETPDRDFVLTEPIEFVPAGSDDPSVVLGHSNVVISARDVRRMYVTYVALS